MFIRNVLMGVSGLTGCQSKGGEKDTVAQDSQTVYDKSRSLKQSRQRM